MDQSISMKFPGQPANKVVVSQVMDMELNCDDVTSDGVASVRQRIARIRSTMDLKDKVEYDSEQKEPPSNPFATQMEKMLRPMIGSDWSVKISPLGKFSDFKMPQDALKGIQGSPLATMAGEMFSEDGLKRMTEQSSIQFEDKVLHPGDTWNTPVEIKSPIGTMTVVREQTYVGPDSDTGLEKIDVKVTVDLEPSNDPKLGGAKVTLKSGSGGGVILFDNKLGRVAKSRVKTTMEMEIVAGPQTIVGDVTVEDVTSPAAETR